VARDEGTDKRRAHRVGRFDKVLTRFSDIERERLEKVISF
jgi:hypothetical protein